MAGDGNEEVQASSQVIELTPSPYYCGQEQAPWLIRLKENSRYYRPSLLWKCRQLPTPECNISLVFSLTIVDTYEYFIKNPDSQNIKQHYDEAK